MSEATKCPSDIKDKMFSIESPLFKPLKAAKGNDWLSVHPENGQSYSDWLKKYSHCISKHQALTIIPIQLSNTAKKVSDSVLHSLECFSNIFFDHKVVVENYLLLPNMPKRRNSHTDNEQFNCRNILNTLIEWKRKHPNVFAVLGVTLSDIYPRDDWNFVFGLANSVQRVGVFSMARYFDNFPSPKQDIDNNAQSSKFLSRLCKVMCHEFCHMFNMNHCVYFNCLMNGSNSLREADQRSVFLCPVCLKKLHHAVGFDVKKRYERLLEFWSGRNEDYVKWLKQRLSTDASTSR